MPGHFTFYSSYVNAGVVQFDNGEYGHAIRTLRHKIGDKIEFTDGIGGMFLAEIDHIGKQDFSARVLEAISTKQKPLLDIFCGIIKTGDRMEWLVEKCTELGASGLYFVKMHNSERGNVNLSKLKKTAIAALKQSHGSWLPTIEELKWTEVLELKHPQKYVSLIPESPYVIPVASSTKATAILIGPEGDFSEKEKAESQNAGFIPLSLGNSVLRTETAAITATAWFTLLK